MDGSTYTKRNVAMIYPQDKTLHFMQPDFVLEMAIHGFAMERGIPEQGLPAKPQSKTFLPFFIRLMHSRNWDTTLQSLVDSALQSDGVNEDVREVMARWFETMPFEVRYRFVNEIAKIAGR